MPQQINVYDAKTSLSKLLAEVETGGKFVITRNGKPIALLGPLPKAQLPRIPGALKGEIWMSPDFDEFSESDAADWYGV